jgi:hypothetical protein
LLRGPHRSLIEAVAESTDDPIHLNRTVCLEDHIEYYIAFESKITPFCGVLRTWLVQNVNHGSGRIAGSRFLLGCIVGHSSVGETAALHYSVLSAACGRSGHAISKTGTGNRAAYAFTAAGTVSVPITAGQRRRTEPVDIGRLVGISFAGQTVWITKSSGLHFVDRSGHSGRSSAAGPQIIDLYFIAWPFRSVDRSAQLGLKNRLRCKLRSLYIQLPYGRLKDFLLNENVWLLGV